MQNVKEIETKLAEFESIMDRYFRRNPIEDANRAQADGVDAFNAWQEESSHALHTAEAELEEARKPLQELQSQIEMLQKQLDAEQPAGGSVEAFNKRAAEYNTMVNNLEALRSEYQLSQEAYNQRITDHNQEAQRRHAQVDSIQQDAKEMGDAYQQWLVARGDEDFVRELNQFYASLHREVRNGTYQYEEVRKYLEQAKMIRLELGEFAKGRQEKAENGLLLVQTNLCGTEPCWMLVDSGANVVSITPELVDVLDLHEFVGDSVEMNLAAGIRVQAKELLLPAMTVNGMKAEYIKAVVLPEYRPGWDGCLGLSFLNRFHFQIQKGRPQSLQLTALDTSTQGKFDVFISHKSQDFSFAKKVYDHLTAQGYSPFLSKLSLHHQGDAEFSRSIEEALEGATHLVVVGSSVAHFKAPWVEREWRMFINLQLSRGRRGNVIPILCAEMDQDQIPTGLRFYQSLSIADPEWETTVVNYLPRN